MRKAYYLLLLLASLQQLIAQETINALDPNSFILGGDQQIIGATLQVQPISLIDLEPDPFSAAAGGGETLEAGNPFTGGGAGASSGDFWVNFSWRSINYQTARIFVRASQPIPAGISIQLLIINTANIGGDYDPNPNYNPINLSTSEQVIVYDFANGYSGNGEGTGYQVQYVIQNPEALSLPVGFEILFEIR